jgi:hypothetical protein
MFYVASLAQFQRNGNLDSISGHIIATINLHSFPVPVAVRSKAYVCGPLPAEIVGSNPTKGMDICLL